MLYLTVFVASLVMMACGHVQLGFIGHIDEAIPEGVTKTMKFGFLNNVRFPEDTLGIDVALSFTSPKSIISAKPEKIRFLPGEHRYFNIDVLAEDNGIIQDSIVGCTFSIFFRFTNGSRAVQPFEQEPINFSLIDSSKLVSFGFLGYSGQPLTVGQKTDFLFGNYGSFPTGVSEVMVKIEVTSLGRHIKITPETLTFTRSSSSTQTLTIVVEKCYEKEIDKRVAFSSSIRITDNQGNTETTLSTQPTIFASIHDTSQDPFIMQTVRGEDENGRSSYENICYEFKSEMGERLEFLNDLLLGFSAVCEFRDSYHIERIFVKTRLGTIVISVRNIILTSGMISTWEDLIEQKLGLDPFVVIQTYGDRVSIKAKSGERKLVVDIERINDSVVKSHLNLIIQQTSKGNELDKFNGGIFGIAANNNYKFLRPVQGDEGTIVIVNDQVVSATLKKYNKSESKCFSLSLDDIVDIRVVSAFTTIDGI
ncbi:unnamed protein product [Dimorphilus gyrociliatus]|uniref:Uncharacterized protein n=1 Tax=Dimorphilus gyrociliatus TaxID=2664684 RepID=A0A7I8VZ36_9ANNE|nr:unnamed protein product [Dimorphilus gyrociliatus]